MYGKATLDIPASGTIGPSHTGGLSDELAMVLGHVAARTLSEQDDSVIVTFENGSKFFLDIDAMDRIIECRGRRTINKMRILFNAK